MTKPAYPEFHAIMMAPESYPDAPRKVRCEETRRSYLYRTGTQVLKVRKSSALYSSPAVKERYARQALSLGRHWAGETMQAVVPILRGTAGVALGNGGGDGEPMDYALRMAQLPDPHNLQRLLLHGKATPALLGRLARFVAERHAEARLDERAADGGRPEHVQELLSELAYQSRKYVGHTVSEPALELIARPLGRYLEEHRRLLARRPKRGRVVDGHGALVPEHVFVHGTDVHALAPLEAQPKFRVLDGANDVALMVNALALQGQDELADLLTKRYAAAAKDRDLPRVLPLYRILQALRGGLLRSQWSAELRDGDKERAALVQSATDHYTMAVQVARELPRPA